MYTNTALYYLNQLGIAPWISRSSSLSSQVAPAALALSIAQYVVLVSSELTDKTHSLLKRMMNYINVPDNELLIVNINDKDWQTRLPVEPPRALLGLGLDGNEFTKELNWNCAAVSTCALEYVLGNPIEKRKIFRDLNLLKDLV